MDRSRGHGVRNGLGLFPTLVPLRELIRLQQLCKQSFPVTAFDVWAPSLEGAVKAGAQPAKSPADAARGVRVLALMPVNKDQVEDVLFGSGGVAEG